MNLVLNITLYYSRHVKYHMSYISIGFYASSNSLKLYYLFDIPIIAGILILCSMTPVSCVLLKEKQEILMIRFCLTLFH